MKINKKQVLRIQPWGFSFLGLILILGSAIGPLREASGEQDQVRSRSQAEILAYQVAQIYRENLLPSGSKPSRSRGPASADEPTAAEGFMGRDSWNQAYSYRVQAQDANRLKVEVRSAGADQKMATEDDISVVLSL